MGDLPVAMPCGAWVSNFKFQISKLFCFVLFRALRCLWCLHVEENGLSAKNEVSNLKFKSRFPQKCPFFYFPGVCPWLVESPMLDMLLCWLLVAWAGPFPLRKGMLALRGNLLGACMQPSENSNK